MLTLLRRLDLVLRIRIARRPFSGEMRWPGELQRCTWEYCQTPAQLAGLSRHS